MTELIKERSNLKSAWNRAEISPKSLTMSRCLLVRPNAFGFASESASDNTYMKVGIHIDRQQALKEHDELRGYLEDLGIACEVFDSQFDTPDAIYPNNVFAFTPQRFVIGRMLHEVRAKEAKHPTIRERFSNTRQTIDLSMLNRGDVCELTGSLIIDHARDFAFCGLTQRCSISGAEQASKALGLKGVYVFPLIESEYHTNICLSVLAGRAAVLAPSSFQNQADARAIQELYGSACLILSDHEKNNFAGNCLAVTNDVVLMSKRAEKSLSQTSYDFFERQGFDLRSVDITEIEKGGGSLRCLLAEIFDE